MQVHKIKTLIDGNGGAPIENAILAVEDGRIAYAGAADGFSIPQGAQVVEHGASYMLPGLIDAHTHFLMDPVADFFGFVARDSQTMVAWRGMKNLKLLLKSGVTYIRDLGGYKYIDIELRKLVNAGEIPGPGLQVAGDFVTMTGGHGWKIGREADGEAEVRKAAREQMKAGANLIKIMATGGNLTPGSIPGAAQLSESELRVACEEAKKYGIKTATHAHSKEGIKNAVLAGIGSVEHGTYGDEEVFQLMIERGTYLCPTLYAPWVCGALGEEKGLSPETTEKCRLASEQHRKAYQLAVKMGVKIAAGTDSGTPFTEHGTSLVQELNLMVEYGTPAMQAIVCATKNGADLLGISNSHGTLETGKAADFIIVENDPIADINALAAVKDVYQAGKKVELD